MKQLFKFSFLFLALALLSKSNAWVGQDTTLGESAEIQSGNLVRDGETIEVDIDGETKSIDVWSVERSGSRVEIQGTDTETGEEHTLEMDDN